MTGEKAFALLVSRVEVRGLDSAGTQLYARDLKGFIVGDSQPGIGRGKSTICR